VGAEALHESPHGALGGIDESGDGGRMRVEPGQFPDALA
jgi:hypothetical protein